MMAPLTAADCDYRADPGDSFPLFARILIRISPDAAVDNFIGQLSVLPDDLFAAQYYAGCHHT
jgi:hypothetical protein